MPKLRVDQWQRHPGLSNPLTGQNDGPYSELALGDQVGLTQFGVHLEELPPGSRSSHRHWHETEDEFVLVVSGELVLVEAEEQPCVPETPLLGRPGRPWHTAWRIAPLKSPYVSPWAPERPRASFTTLTTTS